jgi:hypothetical protein
MTDPAHITPSGAETGPAGPGAASQGDAMAGTSRLAIPQAG